jgi:hypothetical protein
MIYLVTFLAFVVALVMSIYIPRIFYAESTAQALTLIALVSVLGTGEVLWLIPTIVRYFTR